MELESWSLEQDLECVIVNWSAPRPELAMGCDLELEPELARGAG